MDRLNSALGALIRVCVVGVLVVLGLGVWRVSEALCALPKAVLSEVATTRTAALAEIATTRTQLLSQVTGLRGDLTAARKDLFAEVGAIREAADKRIGDTLTRVDTALATVDKLREDVQPTLANVRAITDHLNDSAAITPELTRNALGAVAAFKVTMGQGAKTALAIEAATPGILATVQKIGNNSDAATAKTVAAAEESRRLLYNLATNVTPLPKWLRYPLQVIGLVGSAAVPVVTTERLISR